MAEGAQLDRSLPEQIIDEMVARISNMQELGPPVAEALRGLHDAGLLADVGELRKLIAPVREEGE